MINMTIKEIAEITGARLNKSAQEIQDESIQGVSIDTRSIEKGNLFVPFKGENVDGHRFIDNAFEKGAGASFSEIDNDEKDVPLLLVDDGLKALQELAAAYLKKVDPKVIAITGSNGKTTTKDMVECLLRPDYKVKKTEGNYNNEIGLPLTLLDLDADTEVSILEMGMDSFGDIQFLSEMAEPDIAIITNVGESHIEKLGSRENIAKAKYEIVDGLKENGTFIYSKDYPRLEAIVEKDVPYQILTGGMDKGNDVVIESVEQTSVQTLFSLSTGDYIEIPHLGAHNAQNATLALLAAKVLGKEIYETKNYFKHLSVTKMRMEQTEHESGTLIINDAYNASASSMKSALDTVENMNRSKKVVVLADILELGEYSNEIHDGIGEYLNEKHGIDYLVTYGEAAERINEKADMPKIHAESIEAAADAVRPYLSPETVLLVKGSRGMEIERVINHLS
ncbi:UDP-N-acetylmuramoyl-tripeptide--D-alanyl-D-alanine ligase [Corticicoccus populi]|uniref:UDP-N-acetylmuramoyl-tripeptide--D-alanyl-D-alanine ligase n=1 Tax=Corticicoccus populi TaxID=1812821 RepID=A0ABW5WWE2_9STAP